jgi:hypothetical protein
VGDAHYSNSLTRAARERVRLVPRRRRCHYRATVDVTVEARNNADDPGLVKLHGTVCILVGDDDAAWDMCVTIPVGTIHELLGELGEPPKVAPPPFGPTLF